MNSMAVALDTLLLVREQFNAQGEEPRQTSQN